MASSPDRVLRTLLGLPESVELRWTRHREGDDLGRVEISLRVAGSSLALELTAGVASRLPPWLEEGELSLRASPPNGDTAAMTTLARRVGARFVRQARPMTGELRSVFGVRQRRTFDELAHHHLRDGWDIWHHADGEERFGVGLLRLGFRCNQDCWFCWQGRDWPDAEANARDRIDRLADAGARILSITGGEPTAYKSLPDLISHARARGMQVSVQTNAIGLSRPALLRRLLDAGLAVAFVSFHSSDAAVSDSMTRAPGTWTDTVRGIRAALEAGLDVRLNCVVERTNLAGIEAHAAFIRDALRPYGPAHLLGVSYSHPSRYFDEAAWADHVAPLDLVGPTLVRAATLLTDAGVPVELLGSCGFPVCAVREAPGLLQRLRDPTFPTVQTASRTAAAVCEGCGEAARCLGPRREYLAVHGARGLAPFTD